MVIAFVHNSPPLLPAFGLLVSECGTGQIFMNVSTRDDDAQKVRSLLHHFDHFDPEPLG